jgi:hypothetical protein
MLNLIQENILIKNKVNLSKKDYETLAKFYPRILTLGIPWKLLRKTLSYESKKES